MKKGEEGKRGKGEEAKNPIPLFPSFPLPLFPFLSLRNLWICLTLTAAFRDPPGMVVRQPPTIQTGVTMVRRVRRSALLRAPFHKWPAQLEPRVRSLRSAFRPDDARECTSARRGLPSGSNERVRLKWRYRLSRSARSRQNRLPHDRRSQSAALTTSVRQTVSLRCCRSNSFKTTARAAHPLCSNRKNPDRFSFPASLHSPSDAKLLVV